MGSWIPLHLGCWMHRQACRRSHKPPYPLPWCSCLLLFAFCLRLPPAKIILDHRIVFAPLDPFHQIKPPGKMATMNTASAGRVIRTWNPPPGGVRPADGTAQEMATLFQHLPKAISDHLQRHFAERLLCELFLQMGQIPECIFADPSTGATLRVDISSMPCSERDVGMFSAFFGADEETSVTMTKRRGITGTLHRVSLITHPLKVPEKVRHSF